jgi:hypothetical protein
LESMEANTIGYGWQGRYTLPLAVGIPIVATSGLGIGRLRADGLRRLLRAVVAALVVAQVLAFAQTLRRYAVGSDGTLLFFKDPKWNPPVPGGLVLLAFTALTAFAFWWMGVRPLATTAEESELVEAVLS